VLNGVLSPPAESLRGAACDDAKGASRVAAFREAQLPRVTPVRCCVPSGPAGLP
jgi:hypothetical protein